MRAYLIDINDTANTGVKTVDDWKKIAPLLNCDCFDVTHIMIGDTRFGVYVDDNGLCKDPEDITWGAFRINHETNMAESLLAGSLLIVSGTLDEDGNEYDLTDDEILLIEQHIACPTDEELKLMQGDNVSKIPKNFLIF